MGTRGWRVWRHKGRYLSYYLAHDAYPDVWGVDILRQIPLNPDAIEVWAQKLRVWVEKKMKEFEEGELYDDEWMVGECPKNDTFIEWVYEIDLDNYVFHVQGCPVFNLRRMPQNGGAILERAEGYKHNITGLYPHIPSESRWDFGLKESASTVDSDVLNEYAALSPSAVDDIAPLSSETETAAVRRRFAEVFISMIYKTQPFVSSFFKTHTTRNLNELDKQMCDVLDFLLSATLRPPTVATKVHKQIGPDKPLAGVWNDLSKYTLPSDGKWSSRACWIRTNLCAYFQAHLTDESNLRAGIVGLVRAIAAHAPAEGIVYGVVISITHCALVAYDVKTRAVRHTPVMALLAPWEVRDSVPSTPGISALAALCQHLDDEDDGHPNIRAPKTAASDLLPFDVLALIAAFVQDSETLISFAMASSVCKRAAKARLMLPKLNGAMVEKVCEGEKGEKGKKGEKGADPAQVCCADGKVESLRRMWVSPQGHATVRGVLELFAPTRV